MFGALETRDVMVMGDFGFLSRVAKLVVLTQTLLISIQKCFHNKEFHEEGQTRIVLWQQRRKLR